MTAPKGPEYPDELTVKYWEKKKGLLARISKIKTGITEELKKTKKLFEQIDWFAMDIHRYTKGTYDRKGLEKALKECVEATGDAVQAAYKGMRALEIFLTDKASELKKDKKTAGFSDDVSEMADAARKFSFMIAPGTLSDQIMVEYKICLKSVEVKEQLLSQLGKTFKVYVAKAIKAVREAKQQPMTVPDYAELWSEHLRGIGATCKGIIGEYPELKEPLKIAATQWGENCVPGKAEEIPELLEKDLELLTQFGLIAKKVPG